MGLTQALGWGRDSECSTEAVMLTLPGRTRVKLEFERVVSQNLAHVGIQTTPRIIQRGEVHSPFQAILYQLWCLAEQGGAWLFHLLAVVNTHAHTHTCIDMSIYNFIRFHDFPLGQIMSKDCRILKLSYF